MKSIDVRAPADPQDFQTTYAVPPLPPKNFRVTKTGVTLSYAGTPVFRIADRIAGEGQGAPDSYRIYWIPTGLSPNSGTSERERIALAKMGKLVGSTPASGRGNALTFSAPDQSGKTGKYLCVGVNANGDESVPSALAISPWGLG